MIDELRRALLIWQEIQVNDGLPEEQEDGSRKGSFSSFEAEAKLEELNEALDLDTTGVTSAMILQHMANRYIDAWAFSMRELLAGSHLNDKSFRLVSELMTLLSCRQIQEPIADLQAHLGECLESYGAKDEALSVASDPLRLGILRRDALRAMEQLDDFQFLQGPAAEDAERVNPGVYAFLNVNSAVEAVTRCDQRGVTLAMIRGGDVDDDVMSYFAFFVWNGGTLTMLTDKDKWCHPRQHQLLSARGTGRIVKARLEKAHFPYELLDLSWDDKGKNATVQQRDGLIDWEYQMSKIAELNSVEAEPVVWCVMMLDLIRQRYIRENRQLPALAYTAETVVHGLAPKSSLIVRDGYTPAVLADIEPDELTADGTAHQWECDSTRFNEWLVGRYDLPKSAVNLVSTERGQLLPITHDDGGRELIESFDEPDDDDEFGRKAELSERLCAVTPTAFGTLADLQLDRQWAGRFNQAVLINAQYEQEVANRRDSIMLWIRKKIFANKDALVDACVRQSLLVENYRKVTGTIIGGGTCRPAISDDDVARDIVNKLEFLPSGRMCGWGFNWYGGHVVWLHEDDLGDFRHACIIDGESKATFFVRLGTICPPDVAAVCGVSVDELPDLLRHHYYSDEPYSGNHLLSRLDPVDWAIENHVWKQLHFAVAGCFSRRAYNKRRRELDLPPITDWDQYKDND